MIFFNIVVSSIVSMIAHLLRLVRVEENKGYIRSIHDVVIDPLSRMERN